jgi:hypothetical protein
MQEAYQKRKVEKVEDVGVDEKTDNCLGLAGEQSVDGSGELVAALEELELKDEDEAQQVTAHFADHFATSPSGAT